MRSNPARFLDLPFLESRRSSRTFAIRTAGLVLLTLCTWAASSALAQTSPTAEPSVAVGSVRGGAGTFDVAGTDDRFVYDNTLDALCRSRLGDPARNGSALVAKAGERFDLEVGLISCRSGSTPSTQCRWRIYENPSAHCEGVEWESLEVIEQQAPLASGEGAIGGWLGRLPIEMPQRVGRYELVLECDPPTAAGATPIPFPTLRRVLYATYAEPLAWVSPPPETWYDRGTCWARGIASSVGETEAMEAILGGLYRHGQSYWRYGYANQTTPHNYSFPVHSGDHGSRSIEVSIDSAEDEVRCYNNMCRCSWRQMVETNPVCNFGDCYIFSRIFQGIAAVMGIGGLKPIELYGRASLGFLTPVHAESFDPEFPASVTCAPGAKPCYPYFFGNHSLRLRDRQLFDATFDNVYATGTGEDDYWQPVDDGPIGLSVRGLGAEDTFFDSELRMRYSHSGYGLWSFFHLLPPPEDNEPIDEQGELYFTNQVDFTPLYPTPGGYYLNLEAKVQVLVVEAGEYHFKGALYRGDKLIAFRPDIHTMAVTESRLQADAGLHHVNLTFSGEEIYQSRTNGPYELRIAAHSTHDPESLASMELHSFSEPVLTADYQFSQFGQKTAFMLGEPEVSTPRGPKGYPNLEISTKLFVRERGDFAIQARLSVGGQTLGYSGVRETLGTGNRTVTLTFDGADIEEHHLDGTYRVGVNLFDSDQIVLSSWEDAVGSYTADQFAPEEPASGSAGSAEGSGAPQEP